MLPLSVDRITKRYGSFVAVDKVSFTAQPGRIFGLLGPNGAGKTSTIRMITHITIPDEGGIRFGDTPAGPKTQRVMGYLPEERGLYRKMKVGEQLIYFGRLKGLSRQQAEKAARSWLERFDASTWYGKKVEELSKGMQQKVQFIATILHDPQLCIFDEPFSGLDPINSTLLKDIILELRDQGRTILFASHRMEQVEQLCDDIFLITQGKEVLSGSLREVKQRFGRNTVSLGFLGDDSFIDALVAEGSVHVIARSRGSAELRLLNNTPPRRVLDTALRHIEELDRFEVVEPPLSEIFVMAVNASTHHKAA